MTSELSKVYDPASVESEAYATWTSRKAFSADPKAPGEPYSIVIPPPNVTGALHLGHAINNTLQDILIRKARMEGKNTLWIPGIDHAGIATQAVVEKQLKEQENKTRHDVGRERLVKRIWEWKEQYGNRIVDQLKRLGCSCDWDRTRFTLDEMCARAVRETFFKLFKDGLVFRGKRLVNWDIHLQTSISDDEIYHETVKTFMWYIKYPIEGTEARRHEGTKGAESDEATKRRSDGGTTPFPLGEGWGGGKPNHLIVATTRPETMLGDTAVAVNSQDPRWNWAIGMSVKLPLTGRLIPIIADDVLVDPKFGTGCVKVTPAHDPNDYAVWQRHQGKSDQIDIINILNPDGTLNENAGSYKGMKREVARKKVVEDLTHQAFLLKEEPYETQVGHSDRSKTAIEPYLSDQWFVRMAPLAEPALAVVREGIIKFYPERHAQQYLSWLGEKRDWPISRQLWWGHRIPVWHGEGTKARRHEGTEGTAIHYEGDRAFICIRADHADLVKRVEGDGFVQDPDVLDTWFSSALWPHSTLGWPEKTPELAKWNPTSVLVTARDIITLWVARMVMMNLYNMGENQWTSADECKAQSKIKNQKSKIAQHVPFHEVAINPTILDGKGERMSKSKGNGVDPVDIIETHGADALRFTMTQMATETQDVRLPVKKLPNGKNTSEKFDIGRNFCNKLWNASRFALSNLESLTTEARRHGGASGEAGAPPCLRASVVQDLSLADKWILSRLARTLNEVNDALAHYRFDVYARACYDFFWRDFCDWYVEIVKPAFKDPARAEITAKIVSAALDQSLRLMHPMIPFITETIWAKLNDVRPQRTIPGLLEAPASEMLIHAAWPSAGPALIDEKVEKDFALLQDVITAIRNVRNEHKVDIKRVVNVSVAVPSKETADLLLANKGTIQMLATCDLKAVAPSLPSPANAVRSIVNGCEVYLEGLVDAGAEKQRISKRKEELTKQIAQLKGRLTNEGYLAKAPPHLVEQTRKQLADAEAELAKM